MHRCATMLALLALGVPGGFAVAQTTGTVDAYPGAYADNAITGGAGGITIGNPQAERDAVMARLDARHFRSSNGTMADEPDGGSGMGGSAGGVGSR
ncbi:MAG TPA: hypothetical protein VK822_32635 [Acetobacteraceae bacterium]|nr:hypothetical protein [Acetobacteraceae bacterium]